jgi:hypothetical protein
MWCGVSGGRDGRLSHASSTGACQCFRTNTSMLLAFVLMKMMSWLLVVYMRLELTNDIGL